MSPRTFVHIATVEVRKRMSYRVDFWVNALVGLVTQVGVSYLIVAAIFRESNAASVGGMSARDKMVYYVLALIVAIFRQRESVDVDEIDSLRG